jgi:hypothetical protein
MANPQEKKKDSVIGKVLSNPNSWLKGEVVAVSALICAVLTEATKVDPKIGAGAGALFGIALLRLGLNQYINRKSQQSINR